MLSQSTAAASFGEPQHHQNGRNPALHHLGENMPGKTLGVSLASRMALGVVLVMFASRGPVGAQTLIDVRVATASTDVGAQVYYALDLGLFTKAGLDVQVSPINGGSALVAAVAGGSFDIAQTSIESLATAYERGLRFVVVAPGSTYLSAKPTSELVVSAASTIKTAADLAGKTIAVNGIKSITQIAVQAWIDQNGGKSADSKYYEIPFSEMTTAVKAGRVDAAFIGEPLLGQALASGAKIIGHPYDAVGKDFLISAWFTTKDYAKLHPDIVRKFASALAVASRWANEHQNESRKILEKYSKVKTSPKMARITYANTLIARQVQPVIDVSVKYGELNKSFPAVDLFATASP
jgi:NitT/TauT family transport system substrate-binding protein